MNKHLRNSLLLSLLLVIIIFIIVLMKVMNPTFRTFFLLAHVALISVLYIVILAVYFWLSKSKEEDTALDLEQGPDMLRSYTFKDLESATNNFSKRLGKGGFGSVFEGSFGDGTKAAVKRLEHKSGGQGMKEFSAEVKTIGSINHSNLVRLLGYCVEKSEKLLVYEYMSNGSLDKWIFPQNQVELEFTLDWCTRKMIILDIAKGLSYLHEDCRQNIVHFDIKPQNILLNGDFKAKVSDFGLARFVETDQIMSSKIRGTRGYMAPELWSNTLITEKVDVYSFGVVILETMCGRRNLDYSRGENEQCLLYLVKGKIEEDRLFDLVDKQCDDMQNHIEEAVEMIKIGIWCLQGDRTKRPAMSKVLKVLEGSVAMECVSDNSLLSLTAMDQKPRPGVVYASSSAPPLPVVLSAPR